jgi:hypothetical protein
MTTQNEGEQFDTTTSLPIKSVRAEETGPIVIHVETASSPYQNIRTVPVASVNDIIHLKYVPKDVRLEQRDSSTQT